MVVEHVVGERVAAEQGAGAVRVRADDGDGARRADRRRPAGQRQDAVVRQQHHRLLRELGCDPAVSLRVKIDRRDGFGLERLVEQPELGLLPQHPLHGPVHQLLRDGPRPDPFEQRCEVRITGRQLDVHPGGEGLGGRVAEVGGDAVQRVQERDPEVVGDDGALEPPSTAQQVGQQPRVSGDRQAVDLRVGVHDAPRTAVEDRHLERDEQHVGELTRPGVHRREVAPGPRGRVADEVLERGMHARALQSPDVGRSDRADQVRVLPDALLDASPPRVADDVQHGCEALVDPEGVHGGPDRGPHPLDKLRVEGRTPGERGREGRRRPGRQPGQALLVHDRGDAQPGLGDEAALGVAQPARTLDGVDGARPVHPGEVPQTVPGELLERRRRGHLLLHGCDHGATLIDPEPDQLGDLLLERHHCAQSRGAIGVLVERGVSGCFGHRNVGHRRSYFRELSVRAPPPPANGARCLAVRRSATCRIRR